MKIVDRKTFMQMPKGTVFCKFPRFDETTRSWNDYTFGITEPYIKKEDMDESSADFFAMALGSDLCPAESESDLDTDDILEDMERNPGKEVSFNYSYGRDGMFEGDKVGFAIFSRDEIQLMISELQQALNDGYSKEVELAAQARQTPCETR